MNEISMSNIVGCLGECLCVVRVSAYDMQVDRFDCSPYDWIKKKEQDQKLSAVRSLPLLKIRIVDCDQPVYANTFASSGTKKKRPKKNISRPNSICHHQTAIRIRVCVKLNDSSATHAFELNMRVKISMYYLPLVFLDLNEWRVLERALETCPWVYKLHMNYALNNTKKKLQQKLIISGRWKWEKYCTRTRWPPDENGLCRFTHHTLMRWLQWIESERQKKSKQNTRFFCMWLTLALCFVSHPIFILSTHHRQRKCRIKTRARKHGRTHGDDGNTF